MFVSQQNTAIVWRENRFNSSVAAAASRRLVLPPQVSLLLMNKSRRCRCFSSVVCDLGDWPFAMQEVIESGDSAGEGGQLCWTILFLSHSG